MKIPLLAIFALVATIASADTKAFISHQAQTIDVKVGVTQTWSPSTFDVIDKAQPATSWQVKVGIPTFIPRTSIQGNVGKPVNIDGWRVKSEGDWNIQAGLYFRLTR